MITSRTIKVLAFGIAVGASCNWVMAAEDVAAVNAVQGPDAKAAAERSADPSTSSIPVGDTQSPQPSGDSAVEGIPEIIVTAQKRSEGINNVPIAISAYTGKALKDFGVTDTRDLSKLVPGFSFAESGLDNPVYTLRGVGFNDVSRTANSTVGVYIDEVNLPYPYMTKGASLDLKRIEVLKGPQGILYGRNTTGGAVNYIANKPQNEFDYGLSGTYGSYQDIDTEGFVTGPLLDTLSARLAFRAIQSFEGWQTSATRPGDRLGKQSKQSARGQLEWKPVQEFRSNFSVDFSRDGSEPQAPQAYAFHPQSLVANEAGNATLNPEVSSEPLVPVDSKNQKVADWSPSLPWKLDDTFVAVASRNYWDVSDSISLALIAAYEDFRTGLAYVPQSGLDVLNSEKSQSTHTPAESLELRAAGNLFDERVSWLVGVYGNHDSVTDFQRQYFNTISALFNTVPGVYPIATSAIIRGTQHATADAVFFNTDWKIIEPVKLSLGARFTQDRRSYAGCTQDDPESMGVAGLYTLFNGVSLSEGGTGGATQGSCVTLDENTHDPGEFHGRLDQQNLSYRISPSWKPAENQLYYASYNRGFKAGGFPILGASNGEQYEPVVQEQLDAFELGAKVSGFNTAVFDYQYKNKQLLSNFKDPVFGLLPKLYNAPKSEIEGAEIQWQSRPVKGLFVSAAASYIRTKIIEFSGINFEGNEMSYAGQKINFAPALNIVTTANYETAVMEHLNTVVGADFSYVGGTHSDLDGNALFKIPAYRLLNLRVSLRDPNQLWELTFFGRNITNDFYLLSSPQLSADTIVRYTGMPRTLGATLSYNF